MPTNPLGTGEHFGLPLQWLGDSNESKYGILPYFSRYKKDLAAKTVKRNSCGYH